MAQPTLNPFTAQPTTCHLAHFTHLPQIHLPPSRSHQGLKGVLTERVVGEREGATAVASATLRSRRQGMSTTVRLAAAAYGDRSGEEKREGGLDADGGRREKREERLWQGGTVVPNRGESRGDGPRSSARKEPTRRALRRWLGRWSETEGQGEEAAVARESTTTGRKKAVLATEEAVAMNEDEDGFTEVEGEVERDRREGRAEAAVVMVVGAEEQGRERRWHLATRRRGGWRWRRATAKDRREERKKTMKRRAVARWVHDTGREGRQQWRRRPAVVTKRGYNEEGEGEQGRS